MIAVAFFIFLECLVSCYALVANAFSLI